MRRLTYFVSVTQDGFIAGPGGEFDFFVTNDHLAQILSARYPETVPTRFHDSFGITTGENKAFDTVLMGRGTYEAGLPHGVTSPYRQLAQYVFSKSLRQLPSPDPTLVGGDPVATVRALKAEPGLDIWLCGGGVLAGTLYHQIDTLVIKRHPILIGAGRPLVAGRFAPRCFDLTDQYAVDGGVTISTYQAAADRRA